MPNQTVKLKTEGRDEIDVATELTLAMIEKQYIVSVEQVVKAFQEFYNVALFAHTNNKNPFE